MIYVIAPSAFLFRHQINTQSASHTVRAKDERTVGEEDVVQECCCRSHRQRTGSYLTRGSCRPPISSTVRRHFLLPLLKCFSSDNTQINEDNFLLVDKSEASIASTFRAKEVELPKRSQTKFRDRRPTLLRTPVVQTPAIDQLRSELSHIRIIVI